MPISKLTFMLSIIANVCMQQDKDVEARPSDTVVDPTLDEPATREDLITVPHGGGRSSSAGLSGNPDPDLREAGRPTRGLGLRFCGLRWVDVPVSMGRLLGCGLVNAVDHIMYCLLNLSVSDISMWWSGVHRGTHRCSGTRSPIPRYHAPAS